MLQKAKQYHQQLLEIRLWIIFMMIAVFLSGVTAFPLETELHWIIAHKSSVPSWLYDWLFYIYNAIHQVNIAYPQLAYGTDWLAFAHIVISLAFIGPLRDPIKNIWIIEWAMICCVLVWPLALVAGPLRQIPFFHQVIDCLFGVFGFIPLVIVRRKTKQLAAMVAG